MRSRDCETESDPVFRRPTLRLACTGVVHGFYPHRGGRNNPPDRSRRLRGDGAVCDGPARRRLDPWLEERERVTVSPVCLWMGVVLCKELSIDSGDLSRPLALRYLPLRLSPLAHSMTERF